MEITMGGKENTSIAKIPSIMIVVFCAQCQLKRQHNYIYSQTPSIIDIYMYLI